MISRAWATRRHLACAAILGAVLASAPAPCAWADEAAAPPPIVFVIDDLPWSLDAEELRAAVARELGASVTLASHDGAASSANTLTLRAGTGGQIVLSYHAADGRFTERSVDLPLSHDPAVKIVALLAGNLVRDEAAELTALLRKKAPPESTPSPPATPPAPIPVHEEAPAPKPQAPPAPPISPASAPVPALPPDLPPPCAPFEITPPWIGIDFVPFVGTSSFTGPSSVRRLSLSALGGVSAGTRGVEIGGLFNVASRFTCGAQIAGLFNVTLGPVAGVQGSTLFNLGRGLEGVQAGLLNVSTGAVRGGQVGLVNVAAGAVAGVQVGLVEVAASPERGLQGAQAGLVNVSTGAVRGGQVGLVNVAAGAVTGIQIGLVNVADTCSFCLGLVNVLRHGELKLELWGQESGLLLAGVKHGSGYFHTIYGVGAEPFGGNVRPVLALGVGGHLPLSARFFADLDLIAYSLHDLPSFSPSATMEQVRVVVGARVVPRLAIFAGPTFDVASTWNDRDSRLSPYQPSFALRDGSSTVQGWPGAVLGLSLQVL